MAFTKRASVRLWIDPARSLLVVDAGSQARADEAVSCLVESLDGLPLALVRTRTSAAAAMSDWLSRREAPAGFSVDRDCELRSADETKAAVRYARHALDIDEVRDHVHAGKLPSRLALTWSGRVSFVLSDTMQIRKLNFLDVVFERGSAQAEDGFDADAAIVHRRAEPPDSRSAGSARRRAGGSERRDGPAAVAAGGVSTATPPQVEAAEIKVRRTSFRAARRGASG